MNEIETLAFEQTQDALMAEFLLLFKAGNRAETKDGIEKLKKERKKVNRELDRIELSKINSLVLPAQIQKAINELNVLTQDLKDEKERIQDLTQKLKKIDEYLNQAKKVLEFSSKLFVPKIVQL